MGILRGVEAMKIAVVGAAGRTRPAVTRQALPGGDDVIALGTSPRGPTPARPAMASAAADVLDRTAVAEALAGADTVVSALGIGASRQPTIVYFNGTANVQRYGDVDEEDPLLTRAVGERAADQQCGRRSGTGRPTTRRLASCSARCPRRTRHENREG